jgi:phosphatidylinositol alpha-mannosyltransferase
LKIAQLCPYDIHRPGGVQRHIVDLSIALRALGHDVTVIAPHVGAGAAEAGAPQGAASSNSPGFSIVYIGRGRLFALNETQFEITLAFGDQRKRLKELLRGGAFDVVHFHTLASPFLPIQALRASPAANVATFHAVPPNAGTGSIQRLLSRAFGRWLAPKLDGVILASEVHRNLHGVDAVSPLAVLPPCTNLSSFETEAPPLRQYRDHRVNLLFLGRLEPRKGAMVLLRSYNLLCRKGLPVRLLLAGDGPERAMLERYVHEHRVLDVIFLGRIEPADVPRLYAACDVFCAPSLYAEGFGIVLAEAMASGKPIVAAANAGYRTVLTGEAADFLVPPGDVEACSSKLEILIADPGLRRRLGEWGRREAMRYDSASRAPDFVALYQEAIRSRLRRGKSADR